ncbi:MAG TPA: outer membrane lipoprotein chaperone LolA [Burkholderiaceae bacterium]
MKKLIATLLIAASSGAASADGLKSLEDFMQAAHSARADFTQTVTAPSKDGKAGRTKTSTGTFAFQRPGRFRFDYQKPYVQTIVADGQTLWIFDADLNQVTQRAQAQALGSTPAALLAAAPDLAALRRDYQLDAAPDADGLQWVLATPKVQGGQLQSVRVGFRGAQLAALDILDSFGQRSAIRFANFQSNAALGADTFQFKPPAGADVLKQ